MSSLNSTTVRAEAVAHAFFRPRRRKEGPAPLPAGARTFSIPFEGGHLAVATWGEGPGVLLVHGWQGEAAQFGAFVEPLVRLGRKVIAIDLPAHGRSSGDRTNAVVIARALRKVAHELGPVDGAIAHSFGALSTGLAIADGLPLKRVCLLAPVAEPSYYARFVARTAQLDARETARFFSLLEHEVGRRMSAIEVPELLRNASTRLLVIHDPSDGEVPFDHGRRIADAVAGTPLLSLSASGHLGILRDPIAVAAAVDFVAGQGAELGG